MTYLLLYVDDSVLTACSIALLHHTIFALKREFVMKDLGPLHHFLGVSIQHQANGLFLTQRQFALDVLEHASMVDYKPVSTPVDTHVKVSAAFGPPDADPTQSMSLIGALQYLTFTRPDIAYVVQQICLNMHDLREPHLVMMKRILCYMQGSLGFGLHLQRSASSSKLVVYMNVDWAGCSDTRRSTSGYAAFLGVNLVSWPSKCQNIVNRSSVEAEYRVKANDVAEACWL
jgi:hypothetical protein